MQTVEQRVSQRARDAAHDLRRKQGERIMRAVRDKAAASVLGDDEGDDALDIQAFARFEASLPPSAPVGRDAVERMRAVAEGGTINGTYKMPPFASLQVFRGDLLDLIAALALPPSGIAEMVREMCAGVADQNAAQEREGMAELTTQRDKMAAENAAHMAETIRDEIRSLDLSKGVG